MTKYASEFTWEQAAQQWNYTTITNLYSALGNLTKYARVHMAAAIFGLIGRDSSQKLMNSPDRTV